jgi:hypothetical protein
MSNIIINKTNITSNSGNNKLRYTFPTDVTFKSGDQIATSHINLFFSWYNITAAYNNNFFQYKWWDMNGELTVIVDVLIKDGYYTPNTLYEYIQFVMNKNGHVLDSVIPNPSTGSFETMYLFEIKSNETYYALEFVLSSISELYDFGAGLVPIEDKWKLPTTWKLPSTFESPHIIIPTNNNFGKLVGFKPQTISPIIDTNIQKQYSVLNDILATMMPSSSYIISCNLVDNSLSYDNSILTSFTLPNGVFFGDLINVDSSIIWSNIKPGKYKYIDFQIMDQDYNLLQIIDDNILMVLTINKQN